MTETSAARVSWPVPGFFAAAAFNEVAVLPVAAVDKTGRFAQNFTDRSLRGGFSAALALWGDEQDRAAEADHQQLHRDVRGGVGTGDFADVRYSAPNPQLWKWIAMSGIFLILRSFIAATGIRLSAAETEAAYRQLLDLLQSWSCRGVTPRCPAAMLSPPRTTTTWCAPQGQSNPSLERALAASVGFRCCCCHH